MDLFDYPNTPGFKRYGTSSDAAKAIKPKQKSMQERIMNYAFYCGFIGFIPDEAAAALDLRVITTRARISELKLAGCLVEMGIRRKNADGFEQEVVRIS